MLCCHSASAQSASIRIAVYSRDRCNMFVCFNSWGAKILHPHHPWRNLWHFFDMISALFYTLYVILIAYAIRSIHVIFLSPSRVSTNRRWPHLHQTHDRAVQSISQYLIPVCTFFYFTSLEKGFFTYGFLNTVVFFSAIALVLSIYQLCKSVSGLPILAGYTHLQHQLFPLAILCILSFIRIVVIFTCLEEVGIFLFLALILVPDISLFLFANRSRIIGIPVIIPFAVMFATSLILLANPFHYKDAILFPAWGLISFLHYSTNVRYFRGRESQKSRDLTKHIVSVFAWLGACAFFSLIFYRSTGNLYALVPNSGLLTITVLAALCWFWRNNFAHILKRHYNTTPSRSTQAVFIYLMLVVQYFSTMYSEFKISETLTLLSALIFVLIFIATLIVEPFMNNNFTITSAGDSSLDDDTLESYEISLPRNRSILNAVVVDYIVLISSRISRAFNPGSPATAGDDP